MDLTESISRGFRLAAESLGQGFAFANANWKRIFLHFFLGMLVMALAAVAGAVVGGGFAYLTSTQIGWTAASAIGVLLFLLIFVVGLSYGYAPIFGAVQFIYSGKKAGYFESANVGTGFKWAVVGAAALMAVILAFGGVFYGMLASPLIGVILFMLVYLVLIIVAIVGMIVAYYAVYESAMKRIGPVGALLSSYKLIKANFWETLAFAVIIWAVSYIAGLLAGVVFYLFYFAGLLVSIVMPVVGIAVIAFAFLVMILLQVMIECFIFPMQVLFYKKVVEGKGFEPEKKEPAKTDPKNQAKKK